MSPTDTSSRGRLRPAPPGRQQQKAEARKARLLGALVATCVLAAAGACMAVKASGSSPASTTSTTSPPSSSTSPPTTQPAPSAPTRYAVGLTTYHFLDSARGTVDPANPNALESGRVLTTEVRYPTLKGNLAKETAGAAPAKAFGPFPVIVFAHGFGVSPGYYAPLLDYWVHEGFIVVSPVFPDESTAIVARLGGPNSTEGRNAERDMGNEPGDIPFVLGQFDQVTRKGTGNLLAGVAKTADVGLAGQSDGANVVAALEYGTSYAGYLKEMPAKPRAVAVLSGEEMGTSYAASAASAPLLQVQSDADTCNGASQAANLFDSLEGAPVHLMDILHGVPHLPPYVGGLDSRVVERVTTTFFRLELGWRSHGLSLSSVVSAGSQPGVARMTSQATPSTFASSPPQGSCGPFPPTTGGA